MKIISIIITIITMSTAFAAPVLNKNIAAEGTFVTIWPDHKDPNQFYFAPNFMKIAMDNEEHAKFHFTQYRTGQCSRRFLRRNRCLYKAMITSLMVAGYEYDQLQQAQKGILKVNPNARFSAIPFLSSRVEFGTTLNDFVNKHNCSPRAGQAADEIPCNITLNKRGVSYLMPFLKAGSILPFKFIYKIAGVVEGANNEYSNNTLDYGLTVNLGGDMLIDHEELSVPFLWE